MKKNKEIFSFWSGKISFLLKKNKKIWILPVK